ncbi:MAG: Ig-like domain-containing protein [Eubacteriaceae bacterium]
MNKKTIFGLIIGLLAVATAIFFFTSNGVETAATSSSEGTKKYQSPGKYTETATYKDGKITSTDVTIENAIFTGNVSIDASVGNGNVYFKNVTVKGDVLIEGGEDAIYFDGGTYGKIIAKKKDVKIFFLGNAKSDAFTGLESVILTTDGNSVIASLAIEKSGNPSTITTKGSSKIDSLKINDTTNVILNNPTKLLAFGTGAQNSNATVNAPIDKIQSESKILLALSANAETVIFTGNGKDSIITLSNNAIIANLGTDVPVVINGEGKVTSATTNKSENISGTVVPLTTYLTTEPIIKGSDSVFAIAKNVTRTTESQSSQGWTSGGSTTWETASVTNTKAEINSEPSVNLPTPVPEPPIILVSGVQINPGNATLLIGETLQLHANVLPTNASNKGILWESANPSIAKVTDGLVTALKNGETEVIARSVDGNKTAICKITVQTNIVAVTMLEGTPVSNNVLTKSIPFASNVTFPVVAIVKGSDGSEIESSVTWSPSTIDTSVSGTKEYTGTLNPLSGYVNKDNIKPIIRLTVEPQTFIYSETTPLSQRLYLNNTPESLKVTASVTEEKTIAYQWFSKTIDPLGNEIILPIEGATTDTYAPGVSNTPGTVFYSCKLEAESADPLEVLVGAVVTASTEQPLVPVKSPVITSQPAKPENSKLKSTYELSVTATSENGGSLSYQWFKSDLELNAGGEPIKDATKSTYELPSNSSENGIFYYYVEVINTVSGVQSLPTASKLVSATVK